MADTREDLIGKYKARLEAEFGQKYEPKASASGSSISANYVDFKKELLPGHYTLYERLCGVGERFLKIKPDSKSAALLQEHIDICHLSVTPAGVYSFAILALLVSVMSLSIVFFVLFQSLFLIIFAIIIGITVMSGLMKLPEFFANSWRMKASNQMVQSVFYVATYMRHTSNLELAIRFASDHLSPPLSLDLMKVLWDVETNKYESIRESLDVYLESWRKWNPEFIESFHLIEGSLMESSDERRLQMVDKALNVMLEETYEKMLRYAHELKGPITMLYMLGIILPILGLVILPLVASFLTKDVSPSKVALYIALFYNVTMPIGLYYLGKVTLSKRPTGYGDTDISEENPEMKKFRNVTFKLGSHEAIISPLFVSLAVLLVLLSAGLSPLLMRMVIDEASFAQEPRLPVIGLKLLDYRKGEAGGLSGPFGIGAALLSLLIPLAIGLSVGIYYRIKTSRVIKIRENTRRLEDEFASALFQLGNRLGDGLPAEIAFAKVAAVTKGSVTGEFFETVSDNVSKRGMGLQQAIFDEKRGALVFFPSTLIESTMKVLIESSRKGPLIASQALINVSEYIKQIHRVNERLKDLMADIISDMKQQIGMLAPAIAGIVVGITSMIVTILGRLSDIQQAMKTSGTGQKIPLEGLDGLFGQGIPTYYFQIVVGLYIVEIVYILTILANGIENGADRLAEKHSLGQNMIRSVVIYVVISLIVIVLFNSLASVITDSLLTDQIAAGAS
ncbi:hypothetical protein HYY74_04920 [Candidatus Woesearchaeota archaeon]|nr:hypothetical protein [Candidatus Woesearchaeota archaeon]